MVRTENQLPPQSAYAGVTLLYPVLSAFILQLLLLGSKALPCSVFCLLLLTLDFFCPAVIAGAPLKENILGGMS